jgi:hypothetical protein
VVSAVARLRTVAAQAFWAVCVLAALVLAVATLCIALRADEGNGLVRFLLETADRLDLGVFSRGTDGVAHFQGPRHGVETKNALVDWGLAAVAWLVAGRIVERLVRPRRNRRDPWPI